MADSSLLVIALSLPLKFSKSTLNGSPISKGFRLHPTYLCLFFSIAISARRFEEYRKTKKVSISDFISICSFSFLRLNTRLSTPH